MKKFLAIPLLVLYLVAVSGMMVQLHFCGSKLSSWNLNEPKASCCCGDEPEQNRDNGKDKLAVKADDCCSNKIITLKITQDQNKGNNILAQMAALQVALVLPTPVSYNLAVPLFSVTEEAYQANAPPGLWQGIPLYKLHSRFTYYG